jgi:hypothetical protein
MSDLDCRAWMVERARAVVGLAANRVGPDGYVGAMYLDFLAGGGETVANRTAMRSMSSCGLVVRALWRELLIDDLATPPDARLVAPYVVGSVIATIENMAREAHAWRTGADVSSGETEPQPGDVVLMDPASPHVATLVDVGTGYPCTWVSVDGGQRTPEGGECILERSRTCRVDGRGRIVLVASDGLSPATPRELVGVVDLEAWVDHFAGAVS